MTEIISKCTNLIDYELKTFGFSVLSPSEHKFTELVTLKKRFSNNKCKSLIKKTEIFNAEDLLKSKNKDLAEYKNFCDEIIKILNFKGMQLDSIFITFDNKESEHIAQEAHLDRIPTLKFMLYLNNLTAENGAFRLSPGSNHWTKEKFKNKRKSFYDKDFFNDTRNIPKPILDKMISIEGKAGTIIIFNTDCIHQQGIVHSGDACIIRSHYRERNIQKNYLDRKKQAFKDFLKELFN